MAMLFIKTIKWAERTESNRGTGQPQRGVESMIRKSQSHPSTSREVVFFGGRVTHDRRSSGRRKSRKEPETHSEIALLKTHRSSGVQLRRTDEGRKGP